MMMITIIHRLSHSIIITIIIIIIIIIPLTPQVTEEEMSSLYDTNRVGQYLEQRVIDMRTQFESLSTRYEETVDARESDRVQSLQEEVCALRYVVEQEREKNAHLERELVVAREEYQAEMEQLQSRMDTLSTHFQLSVSSKVLSEKKRAAAAGHKRVLVAEVRGLRSRLDSSTNAVLQLMEANAKLSDAVRCLEGQVGDLNTNIDNLKALIAEHEEIAMRDLIIAEKHMMDESSAAIPEAIDVDGLLTTNEQLLESIVRQTSTSSSSCLALEADHPSHLLMPPPTATAIDKVSLSHLRDLDWLDADQQRSVRERMNTSSQQQQQQVVGSEAPSCGGRDEASSVGEDDSCSSVASRDSTATDPSSSSSSFVVGKSHADNAAAAAAASSSSSSRSIASTVSSKLSLFTGAVGYSLLSSTGGASTARSSMHSSNNGTAEGGVVAAAADAAAGDHHQGSGPTGGDESLKTTTVSASILSSVVPSRLSSMFTMSAINSANTLTPSKIEPSHSGGESASSSDQKGSSPSSSVDSHAAATNSESSDGMSIASDAAAIEVSVALASATGIVSSSSTLPSSASSSSSSMSAADTKPSDPSSSTSISSSGGGIESDRLQLQLPSSSMRMICLRCHGTVEGPKLSTCRCEEPAFSPEQLAGASSGSSSYGSGSMKISWGFASGVLFGVGSLVTSMTVSSSSTAAAAASTSSSSVSADHTGSSCSSSSSNGAVDASISSTSQSNSSEAATDGDHLDSGSSRALCEVDTGSSTTAIAQCAEYGDDAATVSVCEDLSL